MINFIVDGFSSYPDSSIYNSEGSKMSASDIKRYISPINKIFFGNKKEMQKQIYEDICKEYDNICLFSWEYEHHNYMNKD